MDKKIKFMCILNIFIVKLARVSLLKNDATTNTMADQFVQVRICDADLERLY